MDIDEIRNRLREFVSFEEGKKLRDALEEHAKANYKPQHDCSEYLLFMNEHTCDFDREHPQNENSPYVWRLFTIKNQFVFGDCIEECLDNAMTTE